MAHSENATPLGGFSDAGAVKMAEMSRNDTVLSEYLRFHGRVYQHSPSVSLEFFVQRPEAKFIATAPQWERAGTPVNQGSSAIHFVDSRGDLRLLYDFAQCDGEVPPWQWTVTSRNAAAVKNALHIPQNQLLLEGLTRLAVTGETVENAARQLGLAEQMTPEQYQAFGKSLMQCTGEIIAGRLAIGGGNFNVRPDHTAFRMLQTGEQRMMFLRIIAGAAKSSLRQVQDHIEHSMAERQIAKEEEKQNDLRRMEERAGGRQADHAGERLPGDSERRTDQLPDESRGEESERRDRVGDHTGVPEQEQNGVVPGVQTGEPERDNGVVRILPVRRDVSPERDNGAEYGGGADRGLWNGVDSLHGGQLSGLGGSTAVSGTVSDGGAESGQQRMGVPGTAGQAVRGNESQAEHGVRGESGVGEEPAVVHGQHGDAGSGTDTAIRTEHGNGINSTEPLSDSASGSSIAPKTNREKAITRERRAAILREFKEKHNLYGAAAAKENRELSAGDEKVYEFVFKADGHSTAFPLFTKHGKTDIFSEQRLTDALAALEQNPAFQQFVSAQPAMLFDLNAQPEPEQPEEWHTADGMARYVITAGTDDRFGFHVQLWRKPNAYSDFLYSGNGRFCDTLESAREYVQEQLGRYNQEHGKHIHFGNLGNGITCYDISRRDPQTDDYPTVAHISEEGVITWYDNELSDKDDEAVMDMADRQKERFRQQWKQKSVSAKYREILDRTAHLTRAQAAQIFSDPLTMDEKVRKYEDSVIFQTASFPEPEPVFQVYQIKQGEQYRYWRFQSLEDNREANLRITDYDPVYTGSWNKLTGGTVTARLDDLYHRLNVGEKPEGYTGHSLSMSDVVLVPENSGQTAYYVDKVGFTPVPDFRKPKNAPEPLPVSGYDLTLDFQQTPFVRFGYTQEEYLGGLDANGHERRDNYGTQEVSLFLSTGYDGKITLSAGETELQYDPYDETERQNLAEEVRRYLNGADKNSLTMHGGTERSTLAEMPAPRPVQQANSYLLAVNNGEQGMDFDRTFSTLEDAMDAGNDAVRYGDALGYAVVNQPEQKVEVYDGIFPHTGVFTDAVYANSGEWQTLTVHTDAPLRLTEKQQQRFQEMDIAYEIADRISDRQQNELIGTRFFDEDFITRYQAQNITFGNGLTDSHLYDLVQRYRQGEDISRELVQGLLGEDVVFRAGDYGELQTETTENGYTVTFRDVSRDVRYAEIYAACMDMFREGYASVERGRTACRADELRLQDNAPSGSMAVYVEVNWQQGREALREQADTYVDDAVYRDYGDNEEFLNHYFSADHG